MKKSRLRPELTSGSVFDRRFGQYIPRRVRLTPELISLRRLSGAAYVHLGTALVKDAFHRSLAESDLVGARALVVRAIDEDTQRYWQLSIQPETTRHLGDQFSSLSIQ